MSRRTIVGVAVLAAVLARPAALAAQGQVQALPEQTVRYIGARAGTGPNGAGGVLYVEPMKGGQRTEVLMSTQQSTIDFFLKLAPGQPITIGLIQRDGKLILTKVSAYPPRPGEKDPDTAYLKGVEVRKIKDQAVTVLIVTKFDKTTLVEVPKVRAKDGLETSPVLLKAIKAIKPGTLVEVATEAPKRSSRGSKLPVLTFITAWAPWRVGVYAKLGRTKIDKTTYVTVEIKSAGIGLTLFVPKILRYGRPSDDRTILRLLQKFKKGQAVEYKISQDGLNQFIRKIRAGTVRK